jgi:large subunit ribosomal protein L32
MAHPKHRFSKTRTAKRRNSKKLEAKPIYIDQISGEATLYHRVCLESGMYRGRKVMEGTED